MKRLHPLPLSAAVLALGLAVSLPTMAGAESEGHGRRGRGHSSEARGGHSGKREYSRGERSRSSGERAYAYRDEDRGRSDRRGSRERRVDWRDSGPRGSGSRGDVRYRDPRVDQRADARWRDSGRRSDVRWQDSGRRSDAPSYRSRTRYRGDYSGYSNHRSRYYYTASFHRPRFIYRSGFSLGFVIGAAPSYGYRYFDPYCDMGFSHLDAYYDHCNEYGHPDAILVVDARSGYPIASCAYRDGYWVVDDCY